MHMYVCIQGKCSKNKYIFCHPGREYTDRKCCITKDLKLYASSSLQVE